MTSILRFGQTQTTPLCVACITRILDGLTDGHAGSAGTEGTEDTPLIGGADEAAL